MWRELGWSGLDKIAIRTMQGYWWFLLLGDGCTHLVIFVSPDAMEEACVTLSNFNLSQWLLKFVECTTKLIMNYLKALEHVELAALFKENSIAQVDKETRGQSSIYNSETWLIQVLCHLF